MKLKNIKKNKGLLACLLWMVICYGCTQSEVVINRGHEEREEVSACLRLNILSSTIMYARSMSFTTKGTTETDSISVVSGDNVTKSVTDPGETADKMIQNLWAGQYNAVGELITEEYFSSLPTQESVNLPLKCLEGTSHVWVVANTGNLQGKASTENALKALTGSDAFTDEGLPVNNLCIMTGMWSGTITENISADIQLKRSIAKIKFTYSVGGENFSFTPATLELCNVPVQMKYIGDEMPVQLSGDENFKTYTVASPGSSGTHCWYIPENPAGTGCNTGDVATNKTGEGVTHATYIRLTGEAVQDGVTYGDVIFTLYPGNGNNDYSIIRNGLYTIDIKLTGIDFSDKRVTVGTVPEMQDPENLGAEKGATGIFQVTTRPGVPWAFTVPSWLSAIVGEQTYESGTRLDFIGPYKVNFETTTANLRAEIRETSFEVGEKTITVKQNPSSLTTGSSIEFSAEGGSTGSGTLKATKGLPWSATLSSDWGNWLAWNGEAPASGTEATGENETLAVKAVSSNPSSSNRTGTIQLKGGDAISDAGYQGLTGSISVVQKGATLTVTTPELYVGPEAIKLSDSFIATHELPWVAIVTSGTDWLSLLSPQNGTTGTTSQTINYETTLNLNALERKGNITIRVGNEADNSHPGPSANITVKQEGATFNVTSPDDIPREGGFTSVTVSATNGLPWKLDPIVEVDGIASPDAKNYMGSQTLNFSATKNEGAIRTAKFELSVIGAIPERKLNIVVNQIAGLTAFDLEINQSLLNSYNSWMGDKLSDYPPFDYDGEANYNNRKTLVEGGGSYVIQVQKAQLFGGIYRSYGEVTAYCASLEEDGYTDWRLPTMLELKIMYDNKSKIEGGSNAEKFINNHYWSSSIYKNNSDWRGRFVFIDGTLSYGTLHGSADLVRCVRDKK